WLCCWPQAARSDTSTSRKHRKLANESGSRRRSGDFFGRRLASSAASLHLPSTSGHSKQPLLAHRSHEEIRGRRKSHLEEGSETRYHSAPSVIDEVLHRRDWERSSKDLYIPLHPPTECNESVNSGLSSPTKAPLACLDSSAECLNPEPKIQYLDHVKKCKKHYTNIKSSKSKCKESNKDDVKDTDATENAPNFYIGDNENIQASNEVNSSKVKEAKQSFNELVKMKEQVETDRSGAMHHSIDSRVSLSGPYSLPSVEPVGYEEGACYLSSIEGSPVRRGPTPPPATPAPATVVGRMLPARPARHASDGDILAPPLRPESGAFSESDLDVDIETCEERPPAYLSVCATPAKETAI
ncbi:hypothetical protein ACJJTC_007386, partial [Scirpophaga incertulas]